MSAPALNRELLTRAQAGDAAAFEELIRPHLASLRRFAYAFARRWADADDLAQEALFKAFRSLGSFEARASLGTWLYSVVRSVCHDFYRGQLARHREQEDALDAEAHLESERWLLAGPDTLLESKADAEQLWRWVKALPPEFRVPLVLYEIEELSYEDIAKIEGVPVGTIRSRLSRGRQQLRAKLAEHRALLQEADAARAAPRPQTSRTVVP